MSVTIKEITPDKKGLTPFVRFGIDLYKGNDCYVPPLILDEINTLRPDHNPAFDFCRAKSFMAFRDGKPVGRITGIINDVVNERSGHKDLRFGFTDFIDDAEVSDALFEAISEWGRAQGMTSIVGPMGFTDMDHEGMLIEGFDELGTMATIYNYPYYPEHMKRMGFEKDADWVEYRMTVPDSIPEKMARISEIVKKKYGLRVIKYTSRSKIKKEYGRELFKLINESYDQLYGYSPLTEKQIDYYIDMYLGIIRLDGVPLVVDSEGQLVGIGITMPSLSRGLQKSKGKLFPTGWLPLLKALKGKNDVVDLLLVAIKPEYQSKGVNALLFSDLIPVYLKNGYKWAESNPELEDNANVQLQWQYFERRQHRRRRAFRKPL